MTRALIAAAVLALSACTTAPEAPSAPNTSHLAGTSWLRIDDENANPHGATLEFSETGASGYTGCNRWFSNAVRHDGEAIAFGPIGTTRRACLAEVQAATEQNFLAVLNGARYAHYDQDALVLLDAQQNQIARFNRSN